MQSDIPLRTLHLVGEHFQGSLRNEEYSMRRVEVLSARLYRVKNFKKGKNKDVDLLMSKIAALSSEYELLTLQLYELSKRIQPPQAFGSVSLREWIEGGKEVPEVDLEQDRALRDQFKEAAKDIFMSSGVRPCLKLDIQDIWYLEDNIRREITAGADFQARSDTPSDEGSNVAMDTDLEAGLIPSEEASRRWGWAIPFPFAKRLVVDLWRSTFLIRAVAIITVNFASSIIYILLVYTFTSNKDPTPPLLPSPSSPHPYLTSILLSWCATIMILLGYRVTYHETRSQQSSVYRIQNYATRLLLVGVGIYTLVAFGLYKLGVNVLSGVLLSITLAVMFV